MTEKKKIIVTGGAGYIGSHTILELWNDGYEPIIIDNFYNSNNVILNGLQEILNNNLKSYNVDCNDYYKLKKVFDAEKNIFGIIHFAAYKNVGESVRFPLKYYSNNIGALVNILKLMEENTIPRLIFSSTCAIYGEPEILPVSEDSEIHPAKSPYGNTKKICEEILQDLLQSDFKFQILALRYFNPIGAHSSYKIGEIHSHAPGNLVPIITQNAIGIRNYFEVYGNDYDTPDGTCIRDFIHVCDLAKAHVKALDFIKKLPAGSFLDFINIGTGRGYSVMELIHTFEKITEIKLNYKIVDRRPGDIVKMYANVEKANAILNWRAERSIEEALKDAWNWEKNIAMTKNSIIS